MKKVLFILIAGAALSVAFLILAFYFIDFNIHWSANYECSMDGKPYGSVKIDRYATEDKIIYKSRAEKPYTLSYRFITEKLLLKKGLLTPVKYVKEETQERGAGRLTLLVQDFDKSDYLYLEFPAYFTIKSFETGEKTLLFSPGDIMTYMPLMERYNYWKMGTQFFEVLTPVGAAVPPMRDKLEIRSLGDQFTTVMGRKTEADVFLLRSKGLPEAKVTMAKYTHRLLSVELKKSGEVFVITSFAEDPAKRIEAYMRKAVAVAKDYAISSREKPGFFQAPPGKNLEPGETAPLISLSEGQKEIFFKTGGEILSGRMWIPEGVGPFSAVIFIPMDGPMTNGEQMLCAAFGKALAKAGYIMMSFDSPGQGKSQGDIITINASKRIINIGDAIAYLRSDPLIRKEEITLLGHKGGGHIALEAGRVSKDILSCIAIELPAETDGTGSFRRSSRDRIQTALNRDGLGFFDNSYMNTAGGNLDAQIKGVLSSSANFEYFMGTKLPREAYRQYLERKVFVSVMSAQKPVFLLFGKNNPDYSQEAIDALKSSAAASDQRMKIAVFNSLDSYLGKIGNNGDGWQFAADNDVLNSILEWLSEVKPKTASEIDTSAKQAPAADNPSPEQSSKM